MSFNDIEQAWRSPHNQPTAAQLEQDRLKFTATLRRRDLGFYAGMTLVFGWLTVITGRLIWFLLWPDPAKDRIDFTREWAVVPFLMLPWLGAILFVRQHLRRRAQRPDCERSIADSLRALVEQSRLSVSRMKNMLRLHLIGAPLLALCIQQIYAVGKARPHEVVSMIVFMAAVITISVGCLAYALFRNRRETRRLEALLQSYE